MAFQASEIDIFCYLFPSHNARGNGYLGGPKLTLLLPLPELEREGKWLFRGPKLTLLLPLPELEREGKWHFRLPKLTFFATSSRATTRGEMAI